MKSLGSHNKGEMEFLDVLCTAVANALVKLGISLHCNVWETPTMTEINHEDFLGVLKPHHTLWRRLVIIIHYNIYISLSLRRIFIINIYIFFTSDGNFSGIMSVFTDNYDTCVRWKAGRRSFTQHVLMRILPYTDISAAWSTLIGRGMSRLGSHWSRAS